MIQRQFEEVMRADLRTGTEPIVDPYRGAGMVDGTELDGLIAEAEASQLQLNTSLGRRAAQKIVLPPFDWENATLPGDSDFVTYSRRHGWR